MEISDNSSNNKWTFGFSREEITKTLKWGVLGGIVISLIEFPYKIIFDNNLTSGTQIPGFDVGLIYSAKYIFVAVSIIPFIEELLFRGLIYRLLRNKFSVFWGFVGSIASFTLVHGVKSGIMFYIIGAFILTYLYEKTRALGVCVIAHMIWNFSWFAAIKLL